MKRSDALTIMKFFDNNEIFKKLVNHVEGLREKEKFMELAKKYRFNSNLSLYELIQLPPEEIKKVLTSMNLCSSNIGIFPSFAENGEACAMHPSEMMARRFFRRWALESLLELTRHYQMPILCCEIIVKKLSNKDLMNICFVVTDQGEA
uniref:Uncharacterized protein n=1 Tax=Trichogramma kaykai TaxID=54128 RepID=A0ABD2WKP6_9HYME